MKNILKTLVLLALLISGLFVAYYFNYIIVGFSPTLATFVSATLGIGIMIFGGIGAVMGKGNGIGSLTIGLILVVIAILSSFTVTMNF